MYCLRCWCTNVVPQVGQHVRTRFSPLAMPVMIGEWESTFCFLVAVIAMSKLLPFALHMKLGRGTHCVYCTFTALHLAHPKLSVRLCWQKNMVQYFHCLLLGTFNIAWKKHIALSLCWNSGSEGCAQWKCMTYLFQYFTQRYFSCSHACLTPHEQAQPRVIWFCKLSKHWVFCLSYTPSRLCIRCGM